MSTLLNPGQKNGTGRITASGQSLIVSVSNSNAFIFVVTGTWAGTLQFQGTIDGTTYFPVDADPLSGGNSVTQTTTNGQWTIDCAGYTGIRIYCSVYTSGTISLSYNTTAISGGPLGSGAATSRTVGTNKAIETIFLGYTSSEFVRNDYSVTPVTTTDYTQLIESTESEYEEIHISDTSGQTLVIATGISGNEVDTIIIPPGGIFPMKFHFDAGTRISVKAVSMNASAGEINVQLLG